MEIDYQWPFALKTGASITHRGASFDINGFGSRVRVADHVLVDLRAAYPVTKQIEVYGRIENLFKEGYETVYQYGSAGRAAYAGVRLTY
jgi:vitamin B12 transporter